MRNVIVTAADETFMPLLRGLAQSLHQPHVPCFGDFACLDLGLGAESRSWLQQFGTRLVRPNWDLPVNETLATSQPHLRSLTARPFLRNYFPGYERYLWIDADAWIQDAMVIERYLRGAADGSLAIATQIDRSYRVPDAVLAWRANRLRRYFGEQAADELTGGLYFNAGVFALRSDAPHWESWARTFLAGLNATAGKLCCDQTALNYAIRVDRLPVHSLPAICNWTCHLALPVFRFDTGCFHRPDLPHESIGIMHLTAGTKNSIITFHDHLGKAVSMDLRFRSAASTGFRQEFLSSR